ncbi:hypothetical protein JCM5350_001629 [Sporobolomyces pararoseus]
MWLARAPTENALFGLRPCAACASSLLLLPSSHNLTPPEMLSKVTKLSSAIVLDDEPHDTTGFPGSLTASNKISSHPSPARPPLAALRQSSQEDVPRFRRVLSERELLWRRALEHTEETDTVTREEMEAHLKWIEEIRTDFEKGLGKLSPGKMRRGYSYLAEEIGIPQNPQEELVDGKDHPKSTSRAEVSTRRG